MAKFKQIYPEKDGWCEDQFPIMRGYKMACCDCGLVHDVEFDVYEVTREFPDGSFGAKKRKGKKWRVVMRMRRNNRSTGQIRRNKGK